LLQISSLLNFFIIQAEESARGRLYKRPRVDSLPSSSFGADFITKTTISPHKRTRKTSQLPQFRVYQDQNFRTDRDNPSGQNEPTPSPIERQINKIWPHISVEIPFHPEFHSISVESTLKRGPRKPLASLSSIAINGAKKAPKIPQDWLKNQPNDHTSTFFYSFLLFFALFYFFLLI
jgi:hypothetical protein